MRATGAEDGDTREWAEDAATGEGTEEAGH